LGIGDRFGNGALVIVFRKGERGFEEVVEEGPGSVFEVEEVQVEGGHALEEGVVEGERVLGGSVVLEVRVQERLQVSVEQFTGFLTGGHVQREVDSGEEETQDTSGNDEVGLGGQEFQVVRKEPRERRLQEIHEVPESRFAGDFYAFSLDKENTFEE
jgi:hypothetical protein